jgi:hypothetical protein
LRRGRNYWSGVIKNDGIPSRFKSACLVRAISAVSASTGLAISVLLPLWGFLIFSLATIGGILGDRGEAYFMIKKKGLLFGLTAILFRQAEYTIASLSVGYGLITAIRDNLLKNASKNFIIF